MVENRKSKLVKLGRIYQKIPPKFLSILDLPFDLLLKEKSHCPMIVLLAAPRSGSTLTYQILTAGLDCFYLTNMWNMLYATPLVGGLISKFLIKNHCFKFNSSGGFVPGIAGQSEGLSFWQYWSGQGLVEDGSGWNHRLIRRISSKQSKLYGVYRKPFVTGFLGHSFCVSLIRQYFPNSIFIHLKRDILSNAYSIYVRKGKINNGLYSLSPLYLIENRDKLSLHEQVVTQVVEIHKIISSNTKYQDTIQITYEEVCKSPVGFIKKVVSTARNHNFKIKSTIEYLPKNLRPKIISSDVNQDTYLIDKYIREQGIKL